MLDEVQCLEDQFASDAVVFRITDCSTQPLIYNTGADDDHAETTVSDLLDSCPPQWTGDVESQVRTKKSVSVENLQVCVTYVFVIAWLYGAYYVHIGAWKYCILCHEIMKCLIIGE